MLVQTGLGEVGVGAFVAVVELLLAMHPDHVLLEVDTLCELVLAHVAGERLLQLVHTLVGFQVGGGGETLVTIGTRKRFEVGVDQLVLLQVDQLLESLPTWLTVFVLHVAAVGSHLSVSSNVHFQITQLAKPLLALITLVLHLPIDLLLSSNRHFLLFDCRLGIRAVTLLLRRGWFNMSVEVAAQHCLPQNRMAVGFSLHLDTRGDLGDNGREG